MSELDWRSEPSEAERNAGKRWLGRFRGDAPGEVRWDGKWVIARGKMMAILPEWQFAHVDENLQATPWPVVEPAWVAECRAALEPVLGAGEWHGGRFYMGGMHVSVCTMGVRPWLWTKSGNAAEFIDWNHAAEFICAAQERVVGEVADWLKPRTVWTSLAEQLRSGAWRGE